MRGWAIVGIVALVIAVQSVASCTANHTSGEGHAHQPTPEVAGGGAGAGAGAPAQPSAASTAASNPVQREMRLLHEATLEWVTAVANDTLDTIPAGMHRVHGARLVTEDALKNGRYRPPRNGDDLPAFIEQDERFHDELVALLKASEARDLVATARQLGVVLEGCVACHATYR